MRKLLTISWMLVVMLALSYGSWYGYDALQVSLRGRAPKKVTLEELESAGIGDARYVELTGIAVYPHLVYEYPRGSKTRSVLAVFYPLVSKKTLKDMLENEKPKRKIRVIVRRDDLDDATIQRITAAKRITELAPWIKVETVRGVTQRGLGRLPARVRELINKKSGTSAVADNVIYLQKGQTPLALWIPLSILAGCALGFIATVFFGARQFRNPSQMLDPSLAVLKTKAA